MLEIVFDRQTQMLRLSELVGVPKDIIKGYGTKTAEDGKTELRVVTFKTPDIVPIVRTPFCHSMPRADIVDDAVQTCSKSRDP